MIEGDTPGLAQLVHLVQERDALKGKLGAVLLMEVADSETSKYGICEMSSKDSNFVARCIEKPKASETQSRLAIIGRYLLPRDIFEILSKQKPGSNGEIQLTDGLNELAKQGRLLGCVLKGRRFDAGDRLGFLEANLHYYLKSPLQGEVKKLLKGLKI
jgi:UTP--glucose-1-phosphate uridylyltransferase